jgi:RNA polymerase sigma factor (sigma-70 family)
MPTKGSVSLWIQQFRVGDHEAGEKLWERYFESLVEQGRRQLRQQRRGLDDEEDLALLTFEALFNGLIAGEFPRLHDRDTLWSMLLTISRNKSIDAFRHAQRDRRGGGKVQSAAVDGLADMMALEPTPDFAFEVAEELRALFAELDDPTLELITMRKLAGDSNQEIAAEMDCARRTIERKLNLIRKLWANRE